MVAKGHVVKGTGGQHKERSAKKRQEPESFFKDPLLRNRGPATKGHSGELPHISLCSYLEITLMNVIILK